MAGNVWERPVKPFDVVERHVKITTEVTAAVSGHERQVGEGLAKLKGTAMI